MGFLRNVLIVVSDDNEKHKLLDDILGWEYILDFERAEGCFDFTLVNRKENLFVVFKQYYDAEFQITYKQLRDKLLDALNRLIRAFEIYLTDYVERIDCKLVSLDIQKILH